MQRLNQPKGSQMNLFIDIDGVLLGKSTETNQLALANHTQEFLEISLQNFDCYWLTTHCRGSADTAVHYLKPYADKNIIALLKQIKPTNFVTFKTEALFGDFLWIDDQPTAYEFQYLEEQNLLDRWLQVNTKSNIDELALIIQDLKRYLQA